MLKINLENCNNIANCEINIKKELLNIYYAMNGTGKSTIGKAIELLAKDQSLDPLKPFNGDVLPSGSLSEKLVDVLLFNEEFVDTIVFDKKEVIKNAFNVFIKSPRFDKLQSAINEKLSKIHFDPETFENLGDLFRVGQSVLNNISLTKAGDLKKVGLMKNITSSKSIFTLPEKIKKFQPLMSKEYNIDWVGWKNDGGKFDDNDICPFCANELETNYQAEKKVFTDSYSKSGVKSIIEMMGYFDSLKDYMNSDKRDILYKCIKELHDDATILLWIKKFYSELSYLIEKVKNVIEFNSYVAQKDDISKLEEQLNKLKIDDSALEIFNNEKVKSLVQKINEEVESLLKETEVLKTNIGELTGYIGGVTKKAVKDINDFLFMAGINYEIDINHLGETQTQTILKYRADKKIDGVTVSEINKHLSWGERNAFALVLFMHYALSHNPSLIILDDPISSFDTNKKYAIINRLFANIPSKKSFFRKTVLMLTHDFQPVIDFISVGKPNSQYVSANYMRNNSGKVNLVEIKESDIISLPIMLAENAKNNDLNMIHRITSIRKLLEHTKSSLNNEASYNIISSVLHGKAKPTYQDDTEMSADEIINGETYIKKYIPDFIYAKSYNDFFQKDILIKQFISEKNSFFKLQIFRVILSVCNLRSKIQNDSLIKYIDEQFHVENDNIYYLNSTKYDLVPDFVIPACKQFLITEKIIEDK
jgi:ABC-type dipeptide/oligopeptide/nickel transport system ATPase subunit